MHLNAWKKENAALNDLSIDGSDLVWTHNYQTDRINVENFYFPTLLYNQEFQKDIQNPDEINSEDLFRIIRVHVYAQELQNDVAEEDKTITEFQYLTDQSGTFFIAFKDSDGKQYKLKKDLKEAFQVYHNLKAQQGKVKLDSFKQELGKVSHG